MTGTGQISGDSMDHLGDEDSRPVGQHPDPSGLMDQYVRGREMSYMYIAWIRSVTGHKYGGRCRRQDSFILGATEERVLIIILFNNNGNNNNNNTMRCSINSSILIFDSRYSAPSNCNISAVLILTPDGVPE